MIFVHVDQLLCLGGFSSGDVTNSTYKLHVERRSDLVLGHLIQGVRVPHVVDCHILFATLLTSPAEHVGPIIPLEIVSLKSRCKDSEATVNALATGSTV
jgi:hypothetical protein